MYIRSVGIAQVAIIVSGKALSAPYRPRDEPPRPAKASIAPKANTRLAGPVAKYPGRAPSSCWAERFADVSMAWSVRCGLRERRSWYIVPAANPAARRTNADAPAASGVTSVGGVEGVEGMIRFMTSSPAGVVGNHFPSYSEDPFMRPS